MAFDPAQFEALGSFYLGRRYDPLARQPEEVPFLYDSRDLVTHAVCVGMTGSGKTGLCLALLEEAAIDGVPAILIDPKGDLGNLMLAFPNLEPSDFRPWINEDDAARANRTPDEHAAAQADLWRSGLAKWGQGPERIRMLKDKAGAAIFTPGSTSGLPVNVFAAFDAPHGASDEADLAVRARTATAGLLGLMGLSADPVQSREGILLAAILTAAWSAGRSMPLEALIESIQRPPFDKIGVLDIETFFPARERFALVMGLNNILASPSFASWHRGSPLDIPSLLYTPEGKPRLSIFSIAHLDDSERMFFVALLLNEVLAWTRKQTGTTSLRAILYMDEIFGFLPPTANPPSKLPLLTLLKQARAYGLGVVLATQNPVDLDYKALSNAGTWFIGRLQTERDKARVLDGLQGASAGGAFNRSEMETLLASLGNRVFLMKNVHEDAPVVFETRWVMSYLSGPLSRDQIRLLTHGPGAPSEESLPDVPSAPAVGSRPALSPGIPEVFLPCPGGGPVRYHPVILAMATVSYSSARLGFEHSEQVLLRAGIPAGLGAPDWAAAAPDTTDPSLLTDHPAPEAAFEELPASATRAANYPKWEKNFRGWLAQSRTIGVLRCTDPKAVSRPGESPEEFRGRIALACRETRDKATAALRKKYSTRLGALQTRIARAEETLRQRRDRAIQTKIQSAISVGSGLLGAFLGRKAVSASNLGRVTTAARGIGRSMQSGNTVAAAEQNLARLQDQLAGLEAAFTAESASIAVQEPAIETITLKPARGGIANLHVLLGWGSGSVMNGAKLRRIRAGSHS
jgi:hypothetical protein